MRDIYPIKRKVILKETESEEEANVVAWLKEKPGVITSKELKLKKMFNDFYAKNEFVQQAEIAPFIEQLNTQIEELEEEQKEENAKFIELINGYLQWLNSLPSLLNDVNREALIELSNYTFQENVDISGLFLTDEELKTPFELCLNFWNKAAVKPFKSLPVGELHYDSVGITKIQAGYRFTGLQFII